MKTTAFRKNDLYALRAAMIRARACYCADECEHGGQGMNYPDPVLLRAFNLLDMTWRGDLMEVFHGDEWSGNERFKKP